MAATRQRRPRAIRSAITAACALAGIKGQPVEAVEVAGAALYYSEPSRVSAFEGVLEGRHTFAGDRVAKFRFMYDALTGASANGAVPAGQVQTFTRPSGHGSFQVQPGETPLDDTFHDTRVAGSGSFSFPLGRLSRGSFGAYASNEYDYTSFGGNSSFARDFNKRNTTLNLGLSFFNDTVHPVGGRPIPLAEMTQPNTPQPRLDGNANKQVLDVVAGVTQVLNRSTIAEFDYSLSQVGGYQTDPYKVVSVVDASSGDPTAQLFESRPDARLKHAAFARVKSHLGRDIIDLSYRYMTDDWSIGSHTVEANYRWMLRPERFLQPNLRFYRQSAAEFYSRWLLDSQTLPKYVTADYRLGEFDAWTVGLRFGQTVRPGQDFVLRVEYYWQFGDSSPPGAPGALANFDLFPAVDAWIVNAGYSLAM